MLIGLIVYIIISHIGMEYIYNISNIFLLAIDDKLKENVRVRL